jgi:non-ribosomal peptide synthetase component F
VVNVPGTLLDLPDVRAEIEPPAAVDTVRFDLQWAFADTGNGVSGALEYDRELFDPATAERMASDFIRLLESFVDTPDRRLSTLSVMTATQESLAVAFNEPL